MRKIPAIRDKIDGELGKIQESFSQDAAKRYQGKPFYHTLPSSGKSDVEILKQVHEYLELGKFFCIIRDYMIIQKRMSLVIPSEFTTLPNTVH